MNRAEILAKGYIASRNIGWQAVPQRVQNLLIRDYARRRNINVSLSLTEYIMPESFMILDGALETEVPGLPAIVFYSVQMMPKDRDRRSAIYDHCLKHHCELHFALEELVIRTSEDISLVEDILMTLALAPRIET